jgi:hypothetical protein
LETLRPIEHLENDRRFAIEQGLPIYFESISWCGSRMRETHEPDFLELYRKEVIQRYSNALLQIGHHEKHIADLEDEIGMSTESRIEALCQRIETLQRCLNDLKTNASYRGAQAL